MAKLLDSDGNLINPIRRTAVGGSTEQQQYLHDDSNLFSSALAHSRLLTEVMAFFVDHDSGSLKVRRAADSADLHLTWTWSLGEHRGTYVYVRVEHWRLLFGLEVLQQKVLECERGERKPTPDKRVAGQAAG
jgi:hypothetical protein